MAGALGLVSMAAFLYLIDYAARLLRPISILTRVGKNGLTVIAAVYPQPAQGPSLPHVKPQAPGMPSRTIHHAGRSGVILSADIEKLLAESQKANVVVELIPVVGDFVGKDEPLFVLYGNVSSIDENILLSSINFGGPPARRFRRSRSGLDHTADRQERESDSAHTETPCKKLHRHPRERMPDVSKARTPHLSGSSTFIDPLETLTL